MTSTALQVYGWSPAKAEPEVTLDSTLTRPTTTLLLSSHIENAITLDETKNSTTTSSPALLEATVEDDEENHVQRGDPNWIARPRNSFIIFRCEYSRLHTIPNKKRVRYPPGQCPPKPTISKRAAIVWNQLSKEEKQPYEELAQQEKLSHAKRYPHYRFRPAKRKSKKRNTASAQRCLEPPESRPASPPQSTIEDDSDWPSPILTQPLSPTSSEVSPALPTSLLHPQVVDTAGVKAGRRRSSSVPSLPLAQHPQFLGGPKLNPKRSRSAMGRPMVQSPLVEADMEESYCGATYMQQTVDGYYTPDEPLSPGYGAPQLYREPSNISTSKPGVDYIAPTLAMASSSSSLANWNGEFSISQQQCHQVSYGSNDASPHSFPHVSSSHGTPAEGMVDPGHGGPFFPPSLGSWSDSDFWPLSINTDTSSIYLPTPVESPSTEFFGPFVSSTGDTYTSDFPEATTMLQNFDYNFEHHDPLYQSVY